MWKEWLIAHLCGVALFVGLLWFSAIILKSSIGGTAWPGVVAVWYISIDWFGRICKERNWSWGDGKSSLYG